MELTDQDDKPSRGELFVAEWQEKYGVALEEARAAADTTGTAAWQRVYAENREAHRRRTRGECMAIGLAAEAIREQGGSTEDDEKQIKDCVKRLSEEREQHEAWLSRAVQPYQIPAENAADLIRKCNFAADETERNAPLANSGLADEVRAITATWPKVKFDSGTGIVTVQ